MVSWNAGKCEYRYLVTNLPRARYTVKRVDDAYRLRWQIELLFKEWKSYANLQAFDTANPGIAEGLIWAAIAAAAMKRYLAHVTQLSTAKAISKLETLKISKDLFIKVIRENPDAAIELIKILAGRLANTTSQLTQTRSGGASTRR